MITHILVPAPNHCLGWLSALPPSRALLGPGFAPPSLSIPTPFPFSQVLLFSPVSPSSIIVAGGVLCVLAVLAGDFLLSRACITLASLKNTEVSIYLCCITNSNSSRASCYWGDDANEHISRAAMDYYLQKTYYKTASLISNSCKSIALLTGQTAEVSMLAYEYGKNLGLAFQLIDDVLDFTGTSSSLGKGSLSDIRHGIVTAPILYAMEEFPELRSVVDQGLDDPANVDL
ncbi:hypothetical protein Ccrd_026373, partial [Cynara cardunculus var. scolymus]